MDELGELLEKAASAAGRYRATLGERRVTPAVDLDQLRARFGGPLPETPTPADQVLDSLIDAASDGLMATAGPRFFGFVVGGSLDAATAADILATGWDQCAFNAVLSPAAAAAEEAAGTWLKELLGIPATASVGFVTGGQAANTVALAAARHDVLARIGWDVEAGGLLGAPRVRVVAGAERHGTIDRALRLLGFGTGLIEEVLAAPTVPSTSTTSLGSLGPERATP